MKNLNIPPVCNYEKYSGYTWSQCSYPAIYIFRMDGTVYASCEHCVESQPVNTPMYRIEEPDAEPLLGEYAAQEVHES